MLWFMGSSAHFSSGSIASNANAIIACLVIVALLQVNAMVGKQGPLTTVRGVIVSGLVLTVVLAGILRVL